MPPQKSRVVGRFGRPRAQPKGFYLNFRVLRRVFLISLPLAMLGGIFYFVFLSNYFAIKQVNILGLKTIPEEMVRGKIDEVLNKRNWEIAKLRNYFLFSSDSAKAEIQSAFSKIGDIKIEKVYPEALNIKITERDPVGVWCSVGGESIANGQLSVVSCFYFDKLGVIFEEAPRSFGALMITVEDAREKLSGSDPDSLGREILSQNDEVSYFTDAKNLISQNFPFSVKKFVITPKGDFEILTSEDWRVLLNKNESIEYQLSNLKYLLDEQIKARRSELEYVDLRLGNRLYYKYSSFDIVHEN